MARASVADRTVQKLIKELCALITAQFPEATFEIYEGDDPKGIYIYAYADIEDSLDMLPYVSDKMVEIVEEEGVIICVVPMEKAQSTT